VDVGGLFGALSKLKVVPARSYTSKYGAALLPMAKYPDDA